LGFNVGSEKIMPKLKSEKYGGITIQFVKKYKYISRAFPSSPYVVAYVNGEEVARGLTKEEVFKSIKRRMWS